MEVAFFVSLGNERQCKIQHCFCSQNCCRVFSTKQYLYSQHGRNSPKVMSKNVKVAFILIISAMNITNNYFERTKKNQTLILQSRGKSCPDIKLIHKMLTDSL